jgi:hypothetical protein
MYKNREAIAMAGKTRPTNGTKIDGKYAAAIIETPFFFSPVVLYYTTAKREKDLLDFFFPSSMRKSFSSPIMSA